jgi:hypothetical protein
MPRSTGISQSAGRRVLVRAAAPLSVDRQQRLVQLLAAGLERFLAHQSAEPGMLTPAAPGVMYGRHPTDEVTHG